MTHRHAPPDPVLTLHLFPEERSALLDLLRSLTDDDWARPTVCPGWSVKDIAAHLLGDDVGCLSRGRDGYPGAAFTPSSPQPSPDTFAAELLDFINRQNELWVAAARRLSPRTLIDLLDWTAVQTHAYFESLDLFATGGPVTWSGPRPAPVWLDIAREYTERWLHQAQVRDALGAPLLREPRLFAPVLDTFVRALPHTFRDIPAPDDTTVALTISGPAGGQWSLIHAAATLSRQAGERALAQSGRVRAWQLFRGVSEKPAAAVTMDTDVAWRLFTKGIAKAEAIARSTLSGDPALAARVFDAVSIIA